jgi:lactate permease
MRYLLALMPILLVLVLMTRFRWGAHQAGLAGWLAGALLAWLSFGLTQQVFFVSQAKGLLLSFFVLAVMWPALFLYHWNDQNGGIKAVASLLRDAIPEEGMCQILMAWALSGLLEGLAGFGLPIAVVAPMLVAIGVPPLRAVAAVAVGHSWAVTFGDMGVIFQTLVLVTNLDAALIIPWAGLLLGVASLACGLGAACILGQQRHWRTVALLSFVIAVAQYGIAASGLLPLAAFGAGVAGLFVYILCFSRPWGPGRIIRRTIACDRAALMTIASYGALTLLMALLTMVAPLRTWSQSITWKAAFPAVKSLTGHVTPAGSGQVFRPLAHPGTLVLTVAFAGVLIGIGCVRHQRTLVRTTLNATWESAAKASVGVVSMVGLASFMEHCGMSFLLAQGVSYTFAAVYPLLSPGVGMLGAFATGSNNNSNVLFGPLQKDAALLLHIRPEILVAAQTAGGSLGSMIAPVKLILGCSTVHQVGKEGQALRTTVAWGIGIGLFLGAVTLLLARF